MGVPLHAGPPDAHAFLPFGTFVDRPARAGERRDFAAWLAPVPRLTPSVHTNHVAPTTLPLTLTRVERHPHAAQMFIPLVVARYLIVVMPATPDGRPDAAAARAFIVPPALGVAYRPGVWHAGITALDGSASFAVLMWRGAEDDDVFEDIAPLVVTGGERGV